MMDELQKILTLHYKKYPAMQTADFIKLLYQNEFGGKHMAYQEEKSFSLLSLERTLPAVEKKTDTSFENIGNSMCRMYFSGGDSGEISTKTLNRIFIASANSISGNNKNFEIKLRFFETLCSNGVIPLPAESLAVYLRSYRQMDCPPVSHSKIYKERYSPAYRVICQNYQNYFPLFSQIDKLLSSQSTVTIAIEGNCCAGKTSLASLLQTVYDCNVIHMDDFFLPCALRTPQRLNQVGGNIDYDRFSCEAAPGLITRTPFRYRKYNCHTDSFTDWISLPQKRLYIVEGVYSMHPYLEITYDTAVFMHISRTEQKRRILLREPPEMQRRFFNEWIPKENLYFQVMKPDSRCSLHFNTKYESN